MANQNRISIPQGFYLDYVERFCGAHDIDNVGDAVQLIIGDHARLIGVDGVAIAKPETAAMTSLGSTSPTTADAGQSPTNLLAGLI